MFHDEGARAGVHVKERRENSAWLARTGELNLAYVAATWRGSRGGAQLLRRHRASTCPRSGPRSSPWAGTKVRENRGPPRWKVAEPCPARRSRPRRAARRLAAAAMTSRSEVACRATRCASRVVPRLVAKPSSTPISECQGRPAASSSWHGGVGARVNGVGELGRAVTREMQRSGRSGARFDHGGWRH